MWWRAGTLAAVVAASSLGARPAEAESYLVIVTGLGGESAYDERFHSWASAMMEAAQERLGLDTDHLWYYSGKPELAGAQARGSSSKENVLGGLRNLASRARAGDQIFLLLIGHGSSRGGVAKLNLPGPDLTAVELAAALDGFEALDVVVVNTSSASGDWTSALAGKNRVVVTATKSGMEQNETVFGKYFIEAYTGDGADVDKNGRISVLEAYEYARRNVERDYEQGNRLQTEHALLEDDGDGKGSHAPLTADAGDGSRAREAYLVASRMSAEAAPATDDPELAALYQERSALEARVEVLKRQRDALSEDVYLEELESLLVELAMKNRAIDELEGKAR